MFNPNAFDTSYSKLNNQQKKAVDTIYGPVLVVAGPGGGKTQLLALRVANILKQTDVDPKSILCLTFTDSAAQNMRERLTTFIGKDAYKVAIHTFHSFATEVINHNPEFFFSGAIYKPADPIAQHKILNDLFDNLEYNNPFKMYSEDHKYTYLPDVKQAISNIKREGVTPTVYQESLKNNKEFLNETAEIVHTHFSQGMKDVTIEGFKMFVKEFNDIAKEHIQHSPIVDHLPYLLTSSLNETLEEAISLEKRSQTKPITVWKNTFTTKNAITGQIQLNDLALQEKDIELHEQGLFDFDDMLIEVNEAFQKNPNLAYLYQEKYLYVLVDEFQDTNTTQSNLLYNLIDSEYTNGEPNILAVGDDDQAIYKFQGASIKNITDFTDKYPSTEVITLELNYRSSQYILDLSKSVIEQSQFRLSNKLGFPKPLISGIDHKNPQKPVKKIFRTRSEELLFVAKSIEMAIENGVSPDEIAIIVRKHNQLIDMVKICNQLKIPIRYDQGTSVLELPLVKHIISVLRYISTLHNTEQKNLDELLPSILACEAFGLSSKTIYTLSRLAYKNHCSWLEVLNNIDIYTQYNLEDAKIYSEPLGIKEVDRIKEIGLYLTQLGRSNLHETAEQVLDKVLGVYENTDETPQDEYTDVLEEGNEEKVIWHRFSFSLKDWAKTQPDYLSNLSGLKIFFNSLRNYQSDTAITVNEVLGLIDVIEENNISLVDNSPYNQHEKAVQLLTAHKAKGLEFEYVYVLNSVQNIWKGKKKGSLVKLPTNMPFQADSDTDDDFIRLLFVALTRAKERLFITSYQFDDANKPTSELEFLVEQKEFVQDETLNPEHEAFIKDSVNVLQIWLLGELQQRILTTDEKEWLRPTLENYKLSVTHLNNFLDVVNGGPQLFLEQNLLRFPKSKSFSAAYGTAIHEGVAQWYRTYIGKGVKPDFEIMKRAFVASMREQRLTKKQEEDGIAKGIAALEQFYHQKVNEFDVKHGVEVDFSKQQVRVGDAHLTGKLDQIWFSGDKTEAVVVDLKTGKASDTWKGDEMALQKLGRYKRQLIFYRLLIEHSRDFSNISVKEGALLFVEPDKKDGNKVKTLYSEITNDDANMMRELVTKVWRHIQNLDFPDTSGYEKTNKGVEQFIEDLVSGAI
jgi:DNA helicase II / ATP-dependent DNA helicase PcrA